MLAVLVFGMVLFLLMGGLFAPAVELIEKSNIVGKIFGVITVLFVISMIILIPIAVFTDLL